MEGCKGTGWCKNYRCCSEKGLEGCYQCAEFPCAGGMLDKRRIRAFSRFLARYGEDKMREYLTRNESDGIVYHHPGKLTGDYDEPDTEEAIMVMILDGKRASNEH
jgi:hypothetical protein